MRSIYFIIFIFISYSNLFSQYKGSISKAESSLNKVEIKGTDEERRELLLIAKGEIDVAITIEKNISKARTWFVRGNVYAAIAKGYLDIDPLAVEKSIEAFNKVGSDEAKTNDITMIQNTNIGIQNLSSYFVNQAVYALQGSENPNFSKALDEFQNSLKINPNDTLGLLYGGYVAEQLNKFDIALVYYDRLLKLNNLNNENTNRVYQQSINIRFNNCELINDCSDYLKTLGLISKAREIFPNDNYYPSIEINIAMKLNKVGEARRKIDLQLNNDPQNISLLFNKAVLYYNLGLAIDSDKSMEDKMKLDSLDKIYAISINSYKNVLEIEPNNERAILYMIDAYKALAKPYFDMERNLDFLALKGKYKAESDRLKNEGNTRLSDALIYAKGYSNMKGENISENDINSLYPIFSIAEDYESLISILSISIKRDPSNMEYLEVLRNAYIKVKDYENAENIYQIILKNEQ